MKLIHHNRICKQNGKETPRDVASQEQELVQGPENDIRRRAHTFYQERLKTGTPGDAVSDWAIAEGQLFLLRATILG